MCAKRRLGTTGGETWERSEYRIILITDIEDFSGPHRDDVIRVRLRIRLRDLLISALSDNGIEDAQYSLHTTGDGWLVAIDPMVGKPRILGPVVDHLAAALRKRIRRQAEVAKRLRVRLVLHAGDLLVDQQGGLVGDQLNRAFGLLEAQQLRDLLKQSAEPLLVCVSDAVFRQVVTQRHGGLDPAAFEPVLLESNKTRGLGWVRAPGESGLAARAGLLWEDGSHTTR